MQELDAATVNAVPRGADMPTYHFLSAEGIWWSSRGGHEIQARCDLNLQTGQVTGYTTTTNYVQFAGFHSGTSVLFWNSQGTPAVTTGNLFFEADARWFGNPVVRGPMPWGLNIGGQASLVTHLTLVLSDSPDSLDQVLAKVKKIGDAASSLPGFLKDVAGIAGVFTAKPK